MDKSPLRRPAISRLRDVLVVLGGYVLAAVAFTWPLALHLSSRLASVQGPGDSYLNLWILGWDLRVLSTAPSALFTGHIFDAPIFHPAAGTLAYSDHLIPQAVSLLPVYLVTGDPVLCYNLLFVLSLVASAAAMHLFVRRVVGTTIGAWVAGLAWGFWPFHFAHLIHLQLQALYLLPITFLALHGVVAGRRRREAVLLGLAAGVQALASVYYGIIGSIALVVAAVVLAAAVGRIRDGVLWRRFVLAAVVAAVVVAPVGWRYWQVQQREGFGRNLFEAEKGAAALASYVQAPPTNLVYGATGLLRFGPRPGSPWTGARIGPEQELWPGVILVLLAVVGVWRTRRRDARPLVLAMIAVAVVGFVFSLGPDGVRPVYAAAHLGVFGFQAIRAPARFGVLVVFACGVLAALGTRDLLRERLAQALGRRRALGALLVGLVALEYVNVPIGFVEAPPRRTAVGEWLRRAPEPGPVVYLPMALDAESTPAMLETLEHGRPIVNGYSGQRPAFYPALVDAMSTFPGAEALATLKDLGVRFVVSEHAVAAPASPLIERARFGRAVVYELRWTPDAERAVAAITVPPPPPPGPIPFAPGERVAYEITWVGGPLDLAAGTATLTVSGPPYRFTAKAETAPWLSRFFEAHDTYTTQADTALLPLLHERHLREGRRSSDRVFVYDATARRVRVGTTAADAVRGEGIVLPLSPAARDALTAFYYARTLPLAPGFHVALPVNDAGRNVVLDVTVAGAETIAIRGQRVDTWRLVPRIVERVARRVPLDVQLWMTRDARRLPVAFEVSGDFGRVRAELTDYAR